MTQIEVVNKSGLAKDALIKPGTFNSFIGISIRHTFFSKKNIELYIKWMSKTFNESIILLMDDPDRHNLVVFKDLEEEEALEKASEISDDLKKAYSKIIDHNKIENVKVVQFRDFRNDSDYINILDSIYSYTKINHDFHTDLLDLMEINIGKRIEDYINKKTLISEEIFKTKEVLSYYIIEEIASLVYFTELGFKIEIDPTHEFRTKKKLYEGEFEILYKKLNLGERGHIYAKPLNSKYEYKYKSI